MSADEVAGKAGPGLLLAAWVIGWPSGAVRAAVAMKGWEWFVADTFGAPEVGLIEVWGLFLLVSFATSHLSPSSAPERSPGVLIAERFLSSLLLSALTFVSLLVLVSLR